MQKSKIKIYNPRQNGFAVTIAITLMTLTVSAVLAVAILFLREFKLNSDLKYSTQAFYAAETGIEYFLWQYRRNSLGNSGSCSCDTYCAATADTSSCLGNGATYDVTYNFTDNTNFAVPPLTVLSTGSLNNVKRAVKSTF